MTGSIPDPRAEASVEFDQLSLTRKLVLELLAARHRCGEQVWTLEHDRALRPVLEDLQHSGWLGYRSGVVERTWLAWLSDKGRAVLMSGDYVPPIIAADEASGVRRVTAQELADQLEQARREAVIAERQRMARAAAMLPEPGPNSGPYERGYYAALDFARQPDWPTRPVGNSSAADSPVGGVS